MKKKKRIKIIIIAVLVVAVAAGSITGVVYYKNSKGLASVMSVSMISTTNDSTSMTSEGMVCDGIMSDNQFKGWTEGDRGLCHKGSAGKGRR